MSWSDLTSSTVLTQIGALNNFIQPTFLFVVEAVLVIGLAYLLVRSLMSLVHPKH